MNLKKKASRFYMDPRNRKGRARIDPGADFGFQGDLVEIRNKKRLFLGCEGVSPNMLVKEVLRMGFSIWWNISADLKGVIFRPLEAPKSILAKI